MRRSAKGPTVTDVANAAGVSAMTVSRVINQVANVQKETREKVNAVISQLGYVPNPAARSLATGQSCRIALLYGNPSAAYLTELLFGCLSEAAASDIPLVVEQVTSQDAPAVVVARLRAHRANAVIVPSPLSNSKPLVDALSKAKLAVSLVGIVPGHRRTHSVSIDDRAAARTMTEKLLALGHTRIGFIEGDRNQAASDLRLKGYRDGLEAAGLKFDPLLIQQGDFTYRSGIVAAEALLAMSHRPSAIFASNDDMAAAALAVAHRMSLHVPHDVSICGFDDTSIATAIWPTLTTVRQPIGEMAREAVRALVKGIAEGEMPAGLVQFDFEIVDRESTACHDRI